MKSTMYLAGTLGTFLAVNGIAFKFMHWMGANIMLISGYMILISLFIPLYTLYNIKKSTLNKFSFFSGAIGGMVALTGITFKILHFPGAGIMILLGTFIFSLLFIPFYGYNQFRKA